MAPLLPTPKDLSERDAALGEAQRRRVYSELPLIVVGSSLSGHRDRVIVVGQPWLCFSNKDMRASPPPQ